MFLLSTLNQQHSTDSINFSVKRRMRPARSACADRDSMSAFILRFAGMKAFLFLPFSFSSSSSSLLSISRFRGRGRQRGRKKTESISPALVSQSQPVRENYSRIIERSVYDQKSYFVFRISYFCCCPRGVSCLSGIAGRYLE